MELAYIDESGNSGYNGSHTYTLGCVVVPAAHWPNAFDAFIGFRRLLKQRFGLPIRAEVKANFLVRQGGSFATLKLGDQIRQDIYRMYMRLPVKLHMEVMAVVIDKSQIKNQARDPRDIAWEFLFQRLERRSTMSGTPIMLVHDEGEELLVRKLARKARRISRPGSAFGIGQLNRPFSLLVDDPVPRDSRQSYFIQLADLAAYAAFRTIIPPSAKPGRVCPATMWNELGGARIAAANSLKGGTPGVVAWP